MKKKYHSYIFKFCHINFCLGKENWFRKGDFAFISGVVSLVDQEFNDLENEMAKHLPMGK